MTVSQSLLASRLIFILGMVNIVSILLILLTCRCIPGWKLSARLTDYGIYRRFFQYHCYLWWLFWPSVIVHAVFAIGLLGVPF